MSTLQGADHSGILRRVERPFALLRAGLRLTAQIDRDEKDAVGSSQAVDVRHALTINPIKCPRSEKH